MYDAEFIVVGAGPAGSTCAALLARAGREVLLLDQACFPRDKPCGEYLSPGAVKFLAARFARVLPLLHPVPGLRVRTGGGAVLQATFPESLPAAAIRRTDLDLALLQEAQHAGARFVPGARVESAAANGTGAAVSGSVKGADRTWRGGWLVAADGYHSRMVRSLGWDRRSDRQRAAWVRHTDRLSDSPFVELFVGQTTVGVGPLGTATNVCVVADGARRRPGLLARRLRENEALEQAHAARVVSAGVTGDRGLTTACAPRSSRFAGHGRVLVIGDAARFEDPFSGEGIYLALQGAQLAAEALLHCAGADPAPAYAAARRTELEDRYRLSAIIRELLARPRLREIFVGAVGQSPPLASLLIRTIADLELPDHMLSPGCAARLAASAARLLWTGGGHGPGE